MKDPIDILLGNSDPAHYPAYMASRICSLLKKRGVKSVIRTFEELDLHEYIRDAKPRAIVTFEEKLTETLPLPKLFNCPEFHVAKNAFTPIAHFFNDPHRKVIVPDRKLACFAKGAFFTLPLEPPFTEVLKHRPIGVASFVDLISLTHLHKSWRSFFPAHIYEQLIRWSSQFEHNKKIHPLEQLFSLPENERALCKSHSGHDIYFALEQDLYARRNSPWIASCTTFPLHLFGDHKGGDFLLTLPQNVHLHRIPPFVYALSLLEEIEILIIDQPDGLDGPSEYLFHALERGALPLVRPSSFLIELFGEKAPIFYSCLSELQEKCNAFLREPHKRKEVIEELRINAMKLEEFSYIFDI